MTEWGKLDCVCSECSHSWIGVVPIVNNMNLVVLECPSCGKMRGGIKWKTVEEFAAEIESENHIPFKPSEMEATISVIKRAQLQAILKFKQTGEMFT